MADRYASRLFFDSVRIHAAAMYCSDGRFGEHFDEFLLNGLGLPRYDRIAVPGGPGALSEDSGARLEHDAVLDELDFLVEAHGLDRVVLIQHQGCAFYLSRLGVAPDQLRERQIADLAKVTQIIRDRTGVSKIESYFARPANGVVAFETIAHA